MRRLSATLFLSSMLAAVLPACERHAPPRAHAVAVSAPSSASASASAVKRVPGAADDSLDALMREAFPDWRGEPGEFRVIEVPERESPKTLLTFATRPKRVVRIDATHLALATVAYPSTEYGENTAGHSEQGAAGVYLFELRGGRWFKTRAQDAVAWAGSNGELDDIKAIELAPGHPALLVEGSHLGQGETDVWAQVVEIEAAGARVVLADLHLHEDTYGSAGDGCEDWVAGRRTPTPEQLADEYQSRCHEVTGQWRIEPVAGASRGDFVVDYTRHRTIQDDATKLRSFETTQSTVVYRYGASGYTKLSGEVLE